jgi:hypothetical protein
LKLRFSEVLQGGLLAVLIIEAINDERFMFQGHLILFWRGKYQPIFSKFETVLSKIVLKPLEIPYFHS